MYGHYPLILIFAYFGYTATSIQSCQSGYAVLVPCYVTTNDLIATVTEVYCPSGCLAKNLSVWGTDIYTENSSICLAAIHAGLVTNGGGYVTVEKVPGQSQYMGSTRNGLTSLSYNVSVNSFKMSIYSTSPTTTTPATAAIPESSAAEVQSATRTSMLTSSFPSTTASNVPGTSSSTISPSAAASLINSTTVIVIKDTTVSTLIPTSTHTSTVSVVTTVTTVKPASTTSSINVGLISCSDTARDYTGDVITAQCPARCDFLTLVWGSDIYESLSEICGAAIHAGKITSDGGYVTYKKQPVQNVYSGTLRHGVLSVPLILGSWSFVFI